jgi:diketogulonate reductase-like aldo/keto reductase
LPYIVYGTAWKKERTKSLVVQAITAGFRAIDTGNTVGWKNEWHDMIWIDDWTIASIYQQPVNQSITTSLE